MSFEMGQVSFCRFSVSGHCPQAIDQTVLDVLGKHAFVETTIGEPAEVESGFVTGLHLYDTQFTYEKNGFGHLLLFALRVDTNKVPTEIGRAYRLMNEQAMAADNPSGFASKGQKQDARETAQRQMHEDLASGKYRNSKLVPLLWDLRKQVLVCGATSNKTIEQIHEKMRNAFAADIALLSPGTLACDRMTQQGKLRDFDDLAPSPFTGPPAGAKADMEDAGHWQGSSDLNLPSVPWMSSATNLKDFLGNEWLMWLWWQSETHPGHPGNPGNPAPPGSPESPGSSGSLGSPGTPTTSSLAQVVIHKTLDMDCAWGATGKQSLRGEGPGRWREAAQGLALGKWPRKMGLIVANDEHQWELNLGGDTLFVSGGKLPEVTDYESPRERLEARLNLMLELTNELDNLFDAYLADRAGGHWSKTRDQIKAWIAHKHRGKTQSSPPSAQNRTPNDTPEASPIKLQLSRD